MYGGEEEARVMGNGVVVVAGGTDIPMDTGGGGGGWGQGLEILLAQV